MTPVQSEGLVPAARVEVVNARLETLPAGASWALRISSPSSITRLSTNATSTHCSPSCARAEWTYIEREIDIRLVD